MKGIKHFTFLAFIYAFIFLPSCSNDEETIPQITISSSSTNILRDGLVFFSAGGESEIVFTTNVRWTMSFDRYQDWCTLSQDKGEAGTYHINVTATENTTYDDRFVEITILAEDSIRQFMVFQNRKEALILSQKEYNVNTDEQDIFLNVKSNIDFSVTVKDASWIKEEIFQTRGLTDNSIKLHISENEGYDERTGIVMISSKDGIYSEQISITQSAKDIIMLDDNVFTFDESGGIFTVGVTSNVEYIVQISCDWVTEVKENTTRSLLTSHRTFRVKEMMNESDRETVISFYYPSMQKYVDVQVYQHSLFSFDVYSISLMEGYNAILEILGEANQTDLSKEIFSRFCVGK